ncbi:MAG: dehydratase [Alphaproteobacteria bacterium]|nr:dehydratase [Alphaproteobacteria bacterium]
MERTLTFEDFEVGEVMESPSYTVTLEEALAFAKQYDPQYFHIDPEEAKTGPYGRLILSGWHTAAISMRLKAQTRLVNVKGGLLGLGLDKLRWPRASFPGDTFRVVITITGKRSSQSKPSHGIVNYSMRTMNQNGELAMEAETAVWMPRRG